MEIHIRDKKLRKALSDEAECKKRFGVDRTTKLFLRYSALQAAESLATFWPPNSGPERCHELTGDLAGKFSMDLKQPYRLLFTPIAPVSKTTFANELDRWKAITEIEIQGIEDTHG